jgi:hypothetical protein
MRNKLLFTGLLIATSNIFAFTINVPANSNQGATTETIKVQCSQMMANVSLQMICTLPGQPPSESSLVSFYKNGQIVGKMNLNGLVDYASENGSVTNAYQSAPYNFVYTPSLKLNWTAGPGGAVLYCDNIATPTAYCRVIN